MVKEVARGLHGEEVNPLSHVKPLILEWGYLGMCQLNHRCVLKEQCNSDFSWTRLAQPVLNPVQVSGLLLHYRREGKASPLSRAGLQQLPWIYSTPLRWPKSEQRRTVSGFSTLHRHWSLDRHNCWSYLLLPTHPLCDHLPPLWNAPFHPLPEILNFGL